MTYPNGSDGQQHDHPVDNSHTAPSGPTQPDFLADYNQQIARLAQANQERLAAVTGGSYETDYPMAGTSYDQTPAQPALARGEDLIRQYGVPEVLAALPSSDRQRVEGVLNPQLEAAEQTVQLWERAIDEFPAHTELRDMLPDSNTLDMPNLADYRESLREAQDWLTSRRAVYADGLAAYINDSGLVGVVQARLEYAPTPTELSPTATSDASLSSIATDAAWAASLNLGRRPLQALTENPSTGNEQRTQIRRHRGQENRRPRPSGGR